MEKLNSVKKRSSTLWLLSLMKPFWARLLLVTFLIVLANLADLIKPRIYAAIIDDFLPLAGRGAEEKLTGRGFLTGTLTGLGLFHRDIRKRRLLASAEPYDHAHVPEDPARNAHEAVQPHPPNETDRPG